ncbi:serine hydrolase [Christiangramia salexigens]|uniref:Serine hydrolase n=2 Tax=Christiangramia salexigens TaxID=1913577 RepID=A0A1L3J8D4_9FLAO|nr:serine hydrolase [Christiangramia salexigens]
MKIDSIMSATDIPGLSIAVINDNEIVYHRVFGVINTETDIPVSEKTIFEGASLSKPIFAYFVMKMVEQKVIDLDKPLYKYLEHPNMSEHSREEYKFITARMVLSHRTGFPNHANEEKITLAFPPGTDFLYSGEAFQYLAKVICKLKGIDIEGDLNSLFRTEVTEQLNMPHSTFVWNNYLATHKANGHEENNQPTNNSPGNGNWNGKTFSSYSSLHSESSEYANFLIALLKQTGLERDSFVEMFTEHTHFKDSNPLKQQIGQTGWGLGITQKKTEYGTMHMHTGNNHDFQSYMMILPEKDFGIVFFTNSGKAIPFIQGLNSVIGPVF